MHVDEKNDVALTMQQQRRQKPRCVGGSWLFVVSCPVVAACICREDLPRVTMSHNRLGLSLSKRIRHELIAKLNSKRKLQTCEALGQILLDHSRARHAPAPIASPRHILPGPVRRDEASERTCVFLPFSSPPHSCKCIEGNPPFN
jgi:hypothetical protein